MFNWLSVIFFQNFDSGIILGIEGENNMGIFGFFEDKKTKEELMAANAKIEQLEKQLEEKTKENAELKSMLNALNNSEARKTRRNKSQNRSMSTSEEADAFIENINAVKPEYNKESEQAGPKPKKIIKKNPDEDKTATVRVSQDKKEEPAKSVDEVDNNISEKPKRRGRKPKNKIDNTTPLKKNAKTPTGDDDKPKPSKKANGAIKRGRKKKDVDAKASASDIKVEEISVKAENAAEPLEAAVMGIDEYESYDAIKPSKIASKPKRKYIRRKPVGEGKADVKVSKTKKTNQSVKAVKPGKIESYADMLAITQGDKKK